MHDMKFEVRLSYLATLQLVIKGIHIHTKEHFDIIYTAWINLKHKGKQ